MNFDYIEVKNSIFHNSKYPIDINKVYFKNILISDKVAYGKKGFNYFIVYRDDEKVKLLWMMLPKMGGYVKCFD